MKSTTETAQTQEVLGVREAATYLGVSYNHMVKLVRTKKVPSLQTGKSMKGVRIYKPTLIAMMSNPT